MSGFWAFQIPGTHLEIHLELAAQRILLYLDKCMYIVEISGVPSVIYPFKIKSS